MATEHGLLDWFPSEAGYLTANIKLGNREGLIRMVPWGKMTRVEVVFPLIASSSADSNSYLADSAQSWIDEIAAEPMPPSA
jgi:hypothetical protein